MLVYFSYQGCNFNLPQVEDERVYEFLVRAHDHIQSLNHKISKVDRLRLHSPSTNNFVGSVPDYLPLPRLRTEIRESFVIDSIPDQTRFVRIKSMFSFIGI